MDYFKFLFCLTIWINLQYECSVEATQCGVQGHDIELKCVIRTYNKAIVWMKENDILSKDIDIPKEELKGKIVVTGNHDNGEYHLTITKLERKDEGRYYCQLSDEPTRVEVQLVIIDNSGDSQCGIIGQDVELSCGLPKYSVGIWIKGEIVISSKETILPEVKPDDFRVRLRITGNHDKGEFHLTISSIKTSDGGIYSCETLDGLKKVELYIIEGIEQSTFTVPGSRVELYCSLRAPSDREFIQWFIISEQDQIELSNNDHILGNIELIQRLKITGDHSVGEYNLMIFDVRKRDQSQYMCMIYGYKDIQILQQLVVIGLSTDSMITSTTSSITSTTTGLTYGVTTSTKNDLTSEGDVFTSERSKSTPTVLSSVDSVSIPTASVTTSKDVTTTYDVTTSTDSIITSVKESSEDNTVVGVVVGTTVPVVATIAVIIIIVVLISRKKTTKDKSERNSPTKHSNDANSHPDMYYNIDKSPELSDHTYDTLEMNDDSGGYEELDDRFKDNRQNLYANAVIGSNVP